MRVFLVVVLSVACLALLAKGQIPGHLVSPCTEEIQMPLDSFGATIGAAGKAFSHFAQVPTQVAQIRRRNATGFYPLLNTYESTNNVVSDGNTAVVLSAYAQFWGLEETSGNVSTIQPTEYISDYARFLSPTRINMFGISIADEYLLSTWNFTADGWYKISETKIGFGFQFTSFLSSRQNAFWDRYFLAKKPIGFPFKLSIFVQTANLEWILKDSMESEEIITSNNYNLMGHDGEDTIIASLYQTFSTTQRGYLIFFTNSDGTWKETQRITVADLGVTGPGNAGSSFLMLNKDMFLWGVPQEGADDNSEPTGKVFIFARQQNNTWAPVSYLYSNLNVAFGIGLAANDIDVLIGGFTIGPPPYFGHFFAVPKCFFDLNVTCNSNLEYEGLCEASTPVELSSAYTVHADSSLACGEVNATLTSFEVISETEINAVVRVTKNGFLTYDCPVVVTCSLPPQTVPQAPVAPATPSRSNPTSEGAKIENLFSFLIVALVSVAVV